MASKKDLPPPRPPAPKLSLLKSKQSSTGSIAIRFNALSNQDDDDEDIDLSISGDTKSHVVAHLAEETHSEPTSQAGTPMSKPLMFTGSERRSPARESKTDTEKSSFLGGIKETLKDKIQATLAEKILDIADAESKNSVSSSPKQNKDTKLQKANSLDSPRVRSTSNVEQVPVVLKEDIEQVGSSSVQRDIVSDASPVTECAHEVTEDANLSPENGPMKIVDNFYEDEFFEVLDTTVPDEVDGGTKFGTPASSSFKTMMKAKAKPCRSSQPMPLSMSTLLHSVTDQEQDEVFKDVLNSEESSRKNSQEDTPAQIEDNTEIHSKEFHRQKSHDRLKPPPWHKIGAVVIALFAYMIVPLPSYLSGMCVGAALATLVFMVYNWLNIPPIPKPEFILPDISKLPPLQVPEMKDTRVDDGKFKGWMNELMHYDPENYHINQTHSIYVQLEGTTLRLQRPKQNIAKRGMWDEDRPTPSFIHQRHLDIKQATVVLLPFGLCEKRLWSKKYPICLTVSKKGIETQRTGSDSQELTDKVEKPEVESVLSENVSDSDLTSHDEHYQVVDKGSGDVETIFLFGRTCREKEEWFRRLSAASAGFPLPQKLQYVAKAVNDFKQKKRESEAVKGDSSDVPPVDSSVTADSKNEMKFDSDLMEYVEYMGKIMPANTGPKSPKGQDDRNATGARIICDPQILWTNALIGRLFWDFLRDQYWAEKVKEKIQRKLSKIHVPYFIDELTVTDIDLGGALPTLRRASRPYLDEQGLWIDFDVAYNGGFQMSLETKVNLMKLKKKSTGPSSPGSSVDHPDKSLSPATHSDEEDSAESSTDEEEEEKPSDVTESGKGKKLWRIVDKIAQSRYFQQATEYKYIKRAMEEVSNTRLILTVEVKSFVGKLVVNIPQPPTDRLWYGFRATPQLWLSAKPKVGERQVTMTHITDWIEKKLETEFQRVLVLPNLDDIPIPLMRDNLNIPNNKPTKPASGNQGSAGASDDV